MRIRSQTFLFLFCTTALTLSALPAAAQTSPAPPADKEHSPSADAQEEPPILVTGSRIVRDGFTAPTPVTVARSEDLVLGTPSSLPDALNKLPQLLGSSGPARTSPNFASTANHGNVLNLRGIGGLRTLILFDGIRVPPTTYLGNVDVNMLPQLLVERVDVVTAGASSAYGSDAVAGVVNFVLDKDFKGINALAQYGISTRGDGKSYRFGIAGGTGFAGGRGYVLASAEYSRSAEILRNARPLTESNGVGLPLAVGQKVGGGVAGTAGNPLVFARGNVTSNVANFGGMIVSGPAGTTGLRFRPDGSTTPFNAGTPTGTSGIFTGGDGFWLPDENTTLSAPLETIQTYGRLSYELSDNVTAFVQGNWARSTTTYHSQGPGYLGSGISPVRIFVDNPYLPANLQAALQAASTPGNPASFVMRKNAYYVGPITNRDDTEAWMAMAGLEGKLGSVWTWNASYVHGSTHTDVKVTNVFEVRKLGAALDAVRDTNGNIVCRVTLTNPSLYPGCVPMNPFGVGAESQASLDYALGESKFRARTTSDNFMATIQGQLFDLPAGPVSLAAGAEYRRVRLNLTSNSDPSTPGDFTGLRSIVTGARFNNTNVGTANGSVNVKEAFAELSVPLLKDQPLARSLELNGAARVTDYSTSGRVVTWKVGGTYEPVSGVMFRVTRSRDIRAPTLFDLYAGRQAGGGSVVDPHTNVNGPTVLIQQGNTGLRPEIGDSLSLGAVLQPEFLPGFSLSIDYFDLRIKGALATQTPLEILQECERANGAGEVCDQITRPLPFSDRSPANFPTQILQLQRNIASLETRGVDFDASYRTGLGKGNLTLRLYATYTDRYRTKQNDTAPFVEYAGYAENGFGRPKWRGNLSATYANDGFTLFLQQTYFHSMRLGPTQVYAEPKVGTMWYTDATVSYKLPAYGGNAEMFLTVNNLFDRRPPLVPSALSPGINYPTLFGLYDTIGRTFTAGVRFKM